MYDMLFNIFIPFLGYFSINSSKSGLNITESCTSVFAIAEADLLSPSTIASSPKKSPVCN
jgi:hypothetical protein